MTPTTNTAATFLESFRHTHAIHQRRMNDLALLHLADAMVRMRDDAENCLRTLTGDAADLFTEAARFADEMAARIDVVMGRN